MIKQVFDKIAFKLNEIPGISWIDFDHGQLEYFELRPAVDFPAALINIEYPDCKDLGTSGGQQCQIRINIRLAHYTAAQSYTGAPIDERENALEVLNNIRKLQEYLQWWDGDGLFTPLSRTEVKAEKRSDGLKVYNITYQSSIVDTTTSRPQYQFVDAIPDVKRG